MRVPGFAPKADVEVELDRDEALPGETIRATIRATPREDLELQEGRVELVYENEYTYLKQTWTGRGVHTTESRTTTDEKVVEEHRFLEPGTVTAGMPLEHSAELTIPLDAVPSGEGKITKVRWKVVATLARRHALDVHGEARVEVLSRPATDADATPDLDTHGDCELSFRLDRADFGPGDAVDGTLVATPLRECEMNEVRVELVRHEEVPRAEGNEEDVKEAGATLERDVELTAGLPREWSFRLELPAELVPCLKTDRSRVTWKLKGVGSRRMRSDYNVTQPLDVHTAPSERR